MEIHIPFPTLNPLSALGPQLAWTCAFPVNVATDSLSSYLHQSYCVWKTLLTWFHPSPLDLELFPLPLFPEPEGRDVMKTFHSELIATVSHSLHIVQLLFSIFYLAVLFDGLRNLPPLRISGSYIPLQKTNKQTTNNNKPPYIPRKRNTGRCALRTSALLTTWSCPRKERWIGIQALSIQYSLL